MRVAVTCPVDHPVSPGSKFAYRLGRIEDGVHNVLAHADERVPIDEFIAALVEKARAEFPGHDVAVERLVQKSDSDEAEWVPVESEAAATQEVAPAGDNTNVEIGVTAGGEASA